ncbi:hypothetical protein, partial [Burkholderia ubonensis]|uniref:hypothetical protein n=1 Tax=Burkholderia ubonensis TaxID=101571 RepID=UPI001E42154B
MISPLSAFGHSCYENVCSTWRLVARNRHVYGLTTGFWLNGFYAGISKVACAAQDLSVNRVGIFPTRAIERKIVDLTRHIAAKGRLAGLSARGSVKIIVLFHDAATIDLVVSHSAPGPVYRIVLYTSLASATVGRNKPSSSNERAR